MGMTEKTTINFDLKLNRKKYGIHLNNLSEALGVSRHILMKIEESKEIPVDDYNRFHELQPIVFPKLD